MKALFIPSLTGLEIHNAIIGNLVTVSDDTTGAFLEGQSLEAIRETNSIIASPKGREEAAKEKARIAAIPNLTARQLRLWLISSGLSLEAVDMQIDAITDPTAKAKARIEWQYATEYKRTHPLVAQLGGALGLSANQIDAAFVEAAKL